MNKKIAIVTGGTSGIGKATALALRGAGYTVYEFSRREAGVEGLHHIRADITDETQVRAAVQQVMHAAVRLQRIHCAQTVLHHHQYCRKEAENCPK